jgi:HEAT repeat protein
MNRRVTFGTIGLWAACIALVLSAGCGETQKRKDNERDYAAMDPATRLIAVESDGPNAPGAIAVLDQLIQSDNLIYRAQAGQILGTWAAVGNPAIIATALTHRDPLVRSLAQAAYIEHNPDNLAVILIEGNIVEVPPRVVSELVQAGDPLGIISPEEAVKPHIDALRKMLDKAPQESVLAADILTRTHDVGARRVLIHLIETSEGELLAKATRVCTRDDIDLGTTFLPLAFTDGVLARRAAMENLVLRPNPWLAKLAVKGLHDADPAVRHNAIRAVGNMDGAAPVEELAAMLNSTDEERAAEKADVIQSLGVIGDSGANVLRQYIRRGPENPTLLVVALMSYAPNATREDIAWVTPMLGSPSRHIRAAALTVLGRIGHPEAQASIIAAAGDKEILVRATAARALGQLRTAYASMELVKLLKDPSPLVQSMAAAGLGHSMYVNGVPALATLAKQPVPPGAVPIRFDELYGWPELSAIQALGQIGGPKACETLRELLKSKSWLTQAAAAQALGATNNRSDENAKALEALVSSKNPLVKAEARLSLRALGRVVPE